MKKVGVITWYTSENYGTCIQSYALTKTLNNIGYDCICFSHMRYYKDITDITVRGKRAVVRKIKQFTTLKKRKKVKNYQIELELKRKRIKEYGLQNYNWVTPKNSRGFETFAKDCYAFVTGSDQIWNPYYLTRTFLLNFVPDHIKKIAYSSSFGVSELPEKLIPVYKKYLAHFDSIGVREESGKILLETMLKHNVELVLDPALLLTIYDWDLLAKRAMPDRRLSDGKKYIVSYFVGDLVNYNNQVAELSELTGLPVFTLACTEKGLSNYGNVLADAGPYEFLWILKNAEYVCTDSFHAFALSIIFQKNIFIFKRFGDKNVKSQNSRIYSLARTMGLTDYIVSENNEMRKIMEFFPVNYKKVNQLLNIEREKSMNFLKNALK